MKVSTLVMGFCVLVSGLAPFTVRAEEGGFRDEFETYHQENWNETVGQGGVLVQSGAWMRNITIKDGQAFIEPVSGQQFLSSNFEFESADLAFDATFKTFGTEKVPCMYYLGFRNPQEACYFMVQQGALVAVLSKNGTNRVAQECAHLELNKTYRFEIKRRLGKVEMLVDGKVVYQNDKADDLPLDPMPVFLAANVLQSPPPEVKDPSAVVILDNVEVRDVKESAGVVGTPGGKTAEAAQTWTVESAGGALVFQAAPGLGWKSLKNQGEEYLDPDAVGSPVFAIDAGDARYFSGDFTVDSAEQKKPGELTLNLRHAKAGLGAVVTATAGADGIIRLGFQVQNLSKQPQSLQTTFPILGPLTFGGRAKDVSYFYPWRTGALGKVDCNFVNEYGSGCWIQMVAFSDEKKGGGMYVFPEDSTGRIKGIHLKKQSGTAPLIRHSEAIYPFTPRSPFKFRNGLGLSYYYVPRSLAANEKQDFPATRLALYEGNWRKALADYKSWSREWYKPVKTPFWFYQCYTFVPRNQARFWSAQENRYISAEQSAGEEDIVQWSGWWDYLDRTANPSKNLLENWNYGDYDYNQSRGGLKTFKEEIQRLQAKGVRFSVYTDFRFCWRDSRIGKAHGKEWAAMYTPGNYGYYTNPDDTWMVSLYEPNAWADYYAETCARIIRDTGMDGIYLDELMFPFPNYNPDHVKYHEGETPVPVALLAKNVRKIRDAVVEANPEATVMVEHAGSEWLSQVIDGCWVQTFYPAAFPFSEKYFDENSIIYFRFLFPELKLSEWGGGLDSPRRSLFNGVGVDSNSYQDEPVKFAEQLDLISRFRPVFHEVSDAFASTKPEMLVPTHEERLLANRFPADEKLVYTLYNKTGKAFSGPALDVDLADGTHWVELTGDRALTVKAGKDGRGALTIEMPEKSVAVVARLPQLLKVESAGKGLTVQLAKPVDKGVVEVFPEGASSVKVALPDNGPATVDAAALGDASKVVVKVTDGLGVLRDQVVVPR